MRIWGQPEGGEVTNASAIGATEGAAAADATGGAAAEGAEAGAAAAAAAPTVLGLKDFQPGDLLKGINVPEGTKEEPALPQEGTVEFEFAVSKCLKL